MRWSSGKIGDGTRRECGSVFIKTGVSTHISLGAKQNLFGDDYNNQMG
jgi:hypothetical protein